MKKLKKRQQLIRREKSENKEINVDAIAAQKPGKFKIAAPSQKNYSAQKSGNCKRCGKSPPHSWKQCPAKEAECRKCKKKGHFAAVCRTGQRVEAIEESQEGAECAFMGTIQSQKSDVWKQDIQMNGELINFKLDTGAAVTAIPDSMYSRARDGDLQNTQPQQPTTVCARHIQCMSEKGKKENRAGNICRKRPNNATVGSPCYSESTTATAGSSNPTNGKQIQSDVSKGFLRAREAAR